MKRIAMLACGLAAAASFSLPMAAAHAEPPCFSQHVNDCVERVCYLLGLYCPPK